MHSLALFTCEVWTSLCNTEWFLHHLHSLLVCIFRRFNLRGFNFGSYPSNHDYLSSSKSCKLLFPAQSTGFMCSKYIWNKSVLFVWNKRECQTSALHYKCQVGSLRSWHVFTLIEVSGTIGQHTWGSSTRAIDVL